MTVNLYAPLPDVVVASLPQVGRIPVEGCDKASNIQNPECELPRRPLLFSDVGELASLVPDPGNVSKPGPRFVEDSSPIHCHLLQCERMMKRPKRRRYPT